LRAAAFNTYVFNYSNSLSYDKKVEQLELALRDAKTYVKLAPSDPEAYVRLAEILNNYGYESKNHSYNQQALDVANALLKSNNIDKYVRGGATTSRAVAFGNLGQHEDAVREYARAIEINPDEPVYWENRALLLGQQRPIRLGRVRPTASKGTSREVLSPKRTRSRSGK